MQRGYLSDHFTGVAAKRLKAVEIDKLKSNQHEFNGLNSLKSIFGESRIENIPCLIVWLGNDEDDRRTENIELTWYDARENHETRTEFRLYYKPSEIILNASIDDLLVIGKKTDGSVLIIVAKNNSTFENQVTWLFGIDEIQDSKYFVKPVENTDDNQIDYIKRTLLPEFQIEMELSDENYLDKILSAFGETFPSTRIFSSFARDTIKDIDPINESDATLLTWMDQEEVLFRTLEKHIVEKQLAKGFSDVDDFIKYSLSVHNKRKSRAGLALENHLEELFKLNQIRYSRGAITEYKSKPDFIFPSIEEYRDEEYDVNGLMMLGVKTSCKDRWRQVLIEAKRIEKKHLFTLESGISCTQTDEMQAHKLQLVLPAGIHKTYKAEQQGWLMSLQEYSSIVKDIQLKS